MVMHEERKNLSEKTLNLDRARQSLIEELEAVNWYQQRIDATSDEQLKAILIHNRDEEKEHAQSPLERHDETDYPCQTKTPVSHQRACQIICVTCPTTGASFHRT